jgi:iron transport multicopper oxidase
MGAFAAQYIQFDQHDMTVVEIDGVYTKPFKVQQLFIPVAQRYSVIVNSKNNAKKNFAIVASMNEGMFDDGVIPPGLNNNVILSIFACDRKSLTDNMKVTAWLVYDETKPLPPPFDMTYLPFDDTVFVPDDKMPSLGPVTLP